MAWLMSGDAHRMALQNSSERKECNHGEHPAVVDEGALVRRVKLQHPLSVRVRTGTNQQPLRRRPGLSYP